MNHSGDRVENLMRWNVPRVALAQLGAEAVWLLIAVILARWLDAHTTTGSTRNFAPAIAFAVIVVTFNGAFGLYRRDQKLDFVAYVGRLVVAMLIGAPIAYAVSDMLPGGSTFQQMFGEIVILAFAGLIVVRHAVVSPLLRSIHPHRLLVLGTGADARVVETSLNAVDAPGIRLVGFHALDGLEECSVSPGRVCRTIYRWRKRSNATASTKSSSRFASSEEGCCRCVPYSNAG